MKFSQINFSTFFINFFKFICLILFLFIYIYFYSNTIYAASTPTYFIDIITSNETWSNIFKEYQIQKINKPELIKQQADNGLTLTDFQIKSIPAPDDLNMTKKQGHSRHNAIR